MNTVVVIGGGASGMLAALTAAEDKNNRVILLERQQRVGRKLLSTGNGRCNLTNTLASAKNYHGTEPDFALSALEAFPPESVLEYFASLGLLTNEEYGGRVYPVSNSANSVVDILRFALEKSGVELRSACPAREIKRRGEGFTVCTDEGDVAADFVIAACGGAAGAKLGGVTDGYELLGMLGHKRTRLYPSLVQIHTDPTYPRALKGVRAECRVRLERYGETLSESEGELQFIESGVSGPAAFDVSRSAAVDGGDSVLHLDFLPKLTTEELERLLRRKTETYPELNAEELFTGIVHNRLGRMLVKYAGISGTAEMSSLGAAELSAAADACKDLALSVQGTEGFDCAQVTAGGIKTSGVNPETLESWFVPHLFICGELLDVDADCGGYNLQWAWASGRKAGRLGK